MAWIYLILAGLLEIAWALGLKASEGFSRFGISVFTVIGMILSFILLSMAMRTLPVGTAYAVWTGIGSVGTAIFGILYFGDPRDLTRIACILLIVVGVLGLKFLAPEK